MTYTCQCTLRADALGYLFFYHFYFIQRFCTVGIGFRGLVGAITGDTGIGGAMGVWGTEGALGFSIRLLSSAAAGSSFSLEFRPESRLSTVTSRSGVELLLLTACRFS